MSQTTGSRAQVMHGTAKKTTGGLTKSQLKYNKQGKIVSKKASALAKKNNRLVKAGYITKKGEFGVSMRGGGMRDWMVSRGYMPKRYLSTQQNRKEYMNSRKADKNEYKRIRTEAELREKECHRYLTKINTTSDTKYLTLEKEMCQQPYNNNNNELLTKAQYTKMEKKVKDEIKNEIKNIETTHNLEVMCANYNCTISYISLSDEKKSIIVEENILRLVLQDFSKELLPRRYNLNNIKSPHRANGYISLLIDYIHHVNRQKYKL